MITKFNDKKYVWVTYDEFEYLSRYRDLIDYIEDVSASKDDVFTIIKERFPKVVDLDPDMWTPYDGGDLDD